MICYHCGNTLGSGRNCLRCGADVSLYRRIVRISNRYYNEALEKARVRDLTGACQLLNQSLQYDKRNTAARNLLGLVYYEMGELVEALAQWVISRSLQPEENPANQYLEVIQENRSAFETMGQAIKKFNLSLDYALHDSEDLAIIQLRGVINQYPKMLKAYQLLALLYIKEEEYSKAGKILKKALSIDRGNTYCQRLKREVRGNLRKSKNKKAASLEQQIAEQALDEVIIPSYTERPKIINLMLGLGLGLLISACAYGFLIYPSQKRAENTRWNQTAIAYNEKIESRDSTILALTATIEDLTAQLETMTSSLDEYTGENGTIPNYNLLLDAMRQNADEDLTNLVLTYSEIDSDLVTDDSFVVCYNLLKNFIEGDGMTERILEAGLALFNSYQISSAITVLESCLELDADCETAIYYLALCYEAQGDDDAAASYFSEIVERFPDGEYYSYAYRRVG